jgi:hypothetical protein
MRDIEIVPGSAQPNSRLSLGRAPLRVVEPSHLFLERGVTGVVRAARIVCEHVAHPDPRRARVTQTVKSTPWASGSSPE